MRIVLVLIIIIKTSLISFGQIQIKDSLDIMIGQMIMVGMKGVSLNEDPGLISDLQNGLVGGVIVYEKNIDPDRPWMSLKEISSGIQSYSKINSFVAIDQEGGRVNRLKSKYGFPPSRTAAYLGEINDLDSTRFYTELTTSTLNGLGINVNFAPVVDLNLNTQNPIIGGIGRSFSANPENVAQHAQVVIEAHMKNHVLPVAKHFPGHGSSTGDTHLGLVDVTSSWNTSELLPYKILIDSGKLDAVMTAHIINRDLDSDLPATLSNSIITGILKDSLAFKGIIFSDDMHMKAISTEYGFEFAIEKAIQAGVDVLLFSNNISGINESTAANVHSIIKSMVLNGKINYDRIERSFNKILYYKLRL